MKVTEAARAKINLYLDVFPPREDGYHNIKSIMHTVSLADTVTIDTDSSEIVLTCTNSSLPTDSKNLAYRAAELFFRETGISGGARIHIEKNIPIAGGLAGGSANAAAVLRALNAALGARIDINSLAAISAELGADVPFCTVGGCALCTGIGETMTPIPTLPETVCVIANGGEGVSTPAAYKRLDEMYGDELAKDMGNIENAVTALQNGDKNTMTANAFNIFESAVLPTHSVAARLKEIMKDYGATLSMMSGSGPSVFGLFSDEASAALAAEKIKDLGAVSHVCCTM